MVVLSSGKAIRRDRDLKDRRLVQVSLAEQGTLAVVMGKLPETELVMIAESLERIVGLMQMQHVDAGPTDPVLGDTGA
jgi:hypothetical protein